MAEKQYRASLSQSQGREGWSVIFRHPSRPDATGKPGKRIRRGLATKDRAEAEQLVTQMDALLAEPSYWEAASRPVAEQRFDPRVVNAFYDDLTPEAIDFWAIREAAIPLPPP